MKVNQFKVADKRKKLVVDFKKCSESTEKNSYKRKKKIF